jgi:ADP-ribose pyrophosphatase YjhB (NUDIX family)
MKRKRTDQKKRKMSEKTVAPVPVPVPVPVPEGQAGYTTTEDKDEYTHVLQQIQHGKDIKEKYSHEINPPQSLLQMKGIITRIGYAGIGVKVTLTTADGVRDESGNIITEKVIYLVRFPPTDGTCVPVLNEPSSAYDLMTDEHVSLEEATEFWSSSDARQANGLWKGGSWGRDNLLYHSKWCTDSWVGDTVTIDFVKNGIIKFGFCIPGFPEDGSAEVLPNTMNSAWSVNITVDKTGLKYAGYAMNYMMPQYANDLLFIWKNPRTGRRRVKICKRGDASTVDMQRKLMPGAGEHLEPGEAFRFKSSLTRAFREELGVDDVALAQCYVLDLGKFDDPARDPRYWTFYLKDKTFGMKRYSTTHGFALYFHGDAPLLTVPVDNVESAPLGPSEKKWVDLETLDVSSDAWMMEDHCKIVVKAKESVVAFDEIPEEEKMKYLYNIHDHSDNMRPYVVSEHAEQQGKSSLEQEKEQEQEEEDAISSHSR